MLRAVLAVMVTATLCGAARADMTETSGMQPHEHGARCHELDGNSRMPRFPRLAGQSAAYLKKQLADFRAGRRTNDAGAMSGMAETLTEADIEAVAIHFAAQVPRAMAGGAGANPVLGRKIYFEGRRGVVACVTCHGTQAPGAAGAPLIAGQHAGYLEKQLLDFRRGTRRNDKDRTMRRIAAALKDGEIRALAAFASSAAALQEDKSEVRR